MLYGAVIKITLVYSLLHVVMCHLKDMGEITKNWTNVLEHLEKRIIGGTSATNKEYPYCVQFFNFGGLCGGTILTSKIVLTAAHCFDHNKNIAEMKIFSNPRFLFDVQAITHDVWHYEIHQSYGEPMIFSNDIAVIIIHDNFIFGPWVQKASIVNTDKWMRENVTFFVTGWGETSYGAGLKDNELKSVSLYYISKERCIAENRIELGPEMFCLFGDGKRDTCRGDSGGGVLWNGTIVGIVSHGRGCAKTPGMYINVYYLRSWIYENVRKIYNKFCDFHHGNKDVE